MSLSVLLSITFFLSLGHGIHGNECHEGVDTLEGCDPDSNDPGSSGCFTQSRSIFGINVWGTQNVPEDMFDYTYSVMAEYLDSDEDGVVDDPEVLLALTSDDFSKDVAVLSCRGEIGTGTLKDTFWGITRTHDETDLEALNEFGVNEFKRITIEENHHAVHRGLAIAYPEVFSTDKTAELSLGIEQAYDDCEYPQDCFPDCQNYDCNEEENRCVFIEDSCQGVYHYSEIFDGCDNETEGGGCQGSEGYYWPWTTVYGWQENACADIEDEWETCTLEQIASNSLTQILYTLVIGESETQEEYGYRQPSRFPDGKYMDRGTQGLTCDMFYEKSGCEAFGCGWFQPDSSSNLRECVTLPPTASPFPTMSPAPTPASKPWFCKTSNSLKALWKKFEEQTF